MLPKFLDPKCYIILVVVRIHLRKWWPLESIEARVLKFGMEPCITNTYARKKYRLNPRTENYFRPLATLVNSEGGLAQGGNSHSVCIYFTVFNYLIVSVASITPSTLSLVLFNKSFVWYNWLYWVFRKSVSVLHL